MNTAWRSKDTPTMHYHTTCITRHDKQYVEIVFVEPGEHICVCCRESIGKRKP